MIASIGQLGVAQFAEAVVGTLIAYGLTADRAAGITDRLLRITQLTNFQTRDFEGGLAKAVAIGSEMWRMARPLRIEFPSAFYRVTSRGGRQEATYEDDADREAFLGVLAEVVEVVERFNRLCHAYCLMTNHYHLVIEAVEGNLSKGMRHLNGVYTQAANRRHNRSGHLFQGR